MVVKIVINRSHVNSTKNDSKSHHQSVSTVTVDDITVQEVQSFSRCLKVSFSDINQRLCYGSKKKTNV